MDRMDHAYDARADVNALIPRRPSTYLRQVYFDSLVFGEGLPALVRLVGPGHILMGTDYPFDMGETDPLGLLSRVEGLEEKERSMIAGGNAARLLGLDGSL
jgi:aminocarboxymuconate-semialdehyde decarboxylase